MKAKFIPTLLIAFCFALNAADQEAGKLNFAKIISDNMVLQQQKPITIWGWAKPGAVVNVTLTQDVTLGQAAANKLGKTPDVDEGNGEYSVTMRYVEKKPAKAGDPDAQDQGRQRWPLVGEIPARQSQLSTHMDHCRIRRTISGRAECTHW